MLKASQNKNVFSWRLKAAWDGVTTKWLRQAVPRGQT